MIPTKAHAVLIGVDDYSTYDPTNTHNLLGCVNDVRAFWDVCVTSGFAPENIHVLTKPAMDPTEVGGLAANFKEATRENILAEQKVLVDLLAADPRAVGVLVYSGHGAWIDNASEDSAIICPSDFAIDLARPVNDIPVHNLWKGGGSNLTVILDCCHSGGRSGHVTTPAITPRDPHRKHLPTHHAKAKAPHADAPSAPGDVSQFNQGSPDQVPPPKEVNLEAFKALHVEDLALKGMLPIGSQMPLTLTARTLTEHDLKFSPYRNAEHTLHGAKVLAACDVHEAAYQAEFAGRFHGAFTWAVTSTVGQWKVEEAPDGAIRTTIGCGSVQRHAAALLKVFTFKQTPTVHPPSAVHQPFFGHGGTLSETPTGDVFTVEVNPEVKNLKLTLTSDSSPLGLQSKIEIVHAIEFWSLGADFMHELAIASAANHSAMACLGTAAALPAPTSPVTTFKMPTAVSWGTPVSAPAIPAFYSMTGTGPAVVAIVFHLNMSVSPALVTSIDWYQGVVGATPSAYAINNPGRNFTFATTMPAPPPGLTWYRAVVLPA
jgi:hypothetical protein